LQIKNSNQITLVDDFDKKSRKKVENNLNLLKLLNYNNNKESEMVQKTKNDTGLSLVDVFLKKIEKKVKLVETLKLYNRNKETETNVKTKSRSFLRE